MNDRELHELIKAEHEGKWGFSLPWDQTQSGQTLLMNTMPSWMARTWTLHMNQMRYQSGLLLGTSVTNGSADQQTAQQRAQIFLSFGVGDSTERVQVDYPWAGGTFQFHAATFRVNVNNLNLSLSYNALRVPIVGAFVVPTESGRASSDYCGTPTFTTQQITAAAGAPGAVVLVDMPARAVSYRIIPMDVNDAIAGVNAPVITAKQLAGGGVAISTMNLVAIDSGLATAGGLAGDNLYDQQTGTFWVSRTRQAFPITQGASVLAFQNTNAVTAANFFVQFQLDLG